MAALVVLCAVAPRQAVLAQGSLSPPGAPAPTMKTLAQIEPRTPITNVPYTILAPGSYYLTTNLVCLLAGSNGITVAANEVTLDLMGFTLRGPGVTSGDGVYQAPANHSLRLFNGRAVGWGGATTSGFALEGWGNQLSDLHATSNTIGIRVDSHNALRGCFAGTNAQMGIYINDDNCLEHCVAEFNGGYGIYARHANAIEQCTASGNHSIGFVVSTINSLRDCEAHFNEAQGFVADSKNSLLQCTAHYNGGDGFSLSRGNELANCAARSNNGDGVEVSSFNRLSSCMLHGNGTTISGAGLHVISSGNHLTDNTCTDNDWGIKIDSIENFMARNACAGNATNWVVSAGNACLVVKAAFGGAISGDSGGAALGSTDPHANFSY
jgi:hypothetical protein